VGWERQIWSQAPFELHCYTFLGASMPMNYTDAVATCETEYNRAYPVTISGQDENEYVLTKYGGNSDSSNRIWLGLTDIRYEGYMEWIDSSPFSAESYKNWRAGGPHNYLGQEDCVELEGEGIWNDQDCRQLRKVMCEISVAFLSHICSNTSRWYVASGSSAQALAQGPSWHLQLRPPPSAGEFHT
jgi:hypothetical protein